MVACNAIGKIKYVQIISDHLHRFKNTQRDVMKMDRNFSQGGETQIGLSIDIATAAKEEMVCPPQLKHKVELGVNKDGLDFAESEGTTVLQRVMLNGTHRDLVSDDVSAVLMRLSLCDVKNGVTEVTVLLLVWRR